ncbi:MAG: hypothetical protein ACXW2A_18000, partial [Burkholderiales bacterium]
MVNALHVLRRALLAGGAALALSALSYDAWSQGTWRPDKPVELIIPTGPGANNDRMVRIVQKVLQDQKLVTTPISA